MVYNCTYYRPLSHYHVWLHSDPNDTDSITESNSHRSFSPRFMACHLVWKGRHENNIINRMAHSGISNKTHIYVKKSYYCALSLISNTKQSPESKRLINFYVFIATSLNQYTETYSGLTRIGFYAPKINLQSVVKAAAPSLACLVISWIFTAFLLFTTTPPSLVYHQHWL